MEGKTSNLSTLSKKNSVPPGWNSTIFPHPITKCIHEVFEEQVFLTPESTAVEISGNKLSFHELNQRSNQLARVLRKRGVKPNNFVGISVERSLHMIVGIYGILKAGAAYVPMDPIYPKDRLRYMVSTAKISVLLTQENLVAQFGDLSDVDTICLDSEWPTIDNEDISNLESVVTPDDLIYLIFTSGSTGQPKAAAVYHRNFMNLLYWFVTEFNITSSDRNLLVSSLSFDLTQKNLYAPLIRGGQLHLAPPGPYDPLQLVSLIEGHDITLINCTPSAFYPLIEIPSEESLIRLSTMRIIFLGGEPISIPRVRKLLSHPSSNVKIANTYGPTECTDICGFYLMTEENIDEFDFVPLGKPIHNVQLLIVDDGLNPCSVGDSGELCIGGAGIGAGYINDSQMTAAKFIQNPFENISGPTIYRTGDQARWLAGGVIEFLGRMDHQIKIRGFRIELHEIEAVLNNHPEVRDAVVIVRKKAGDEENARLVCYFMSFEGSNLEVETIRNYLSEKLPAYMIPSAFHFLPLFPLSPNGKVDRRALQNAPEPIPNLKKHPIDAPESVMEQKIHQIWSTVIGISQIGMEDNFFDAGGNSIQLAQIHVKLQDLIEREFPITDLIVHPNIRAIAACFVDSPKKESGIDLVRERAQQQRKSLAARRNLRH